MPQTPMFVGFPAFFGRWCKSPDCSERPWAFFRCSKAERCARRGSPDPAESATAGLPQLGDLRSDGWRGRETRHSASRRACPRASPGAGMDPAARGGLC